MTACQESSVIPPLEEARPTVCHASATLATIRGALEVGRTGPIGRHSVSPLLDMMW